MEAIRKPFQGVMNIVRFNWHFYVFAYVFVGVLLFVGFLFVPPYHLYVQLLCLGIVAAIATSLFVSCYIYDFSSLYSLKWLPQTNKTSNVVNIHAGFDETSALLSAKFSKATLTVFDFYDSEKHTEISIKRARKAYPSYPGTISIQTSHIPLPDESADVQLLTLAAHEIRSNDERIAFFKELNRVLKPGGRVYVTEHLRDVPNFLAYNIGCFHFQAKATWKHTFAMSGFRIVNEARIAFFITTFTLEKYAVTP